MLRKGDGKNEGGTSAWASSPRFVEANQTVRNSPAILQEATPICWKLGRKFVRNVRVRPFRERLQVGQTRFNSLRPSPRTKAW